MKARSGRGRGFTPADDTLLNRPGVFLTIPLTSLHTDTEYQRPLTGYRVDRIKENWSWIACGCITVALRGNGSGEYYVIDGQHRIAAAERAGIAELPCLVFESVTHTDEAQGFLDVNTGRKAMSVLDRYRALLVVGDPIAVIAKELLDTANRVPTVNRNDGQAVKCLDYIMSAISTDEDTLRKLWPLIIDVCDGRLMTKRVLQGLFYIERFITNTSLLERHWRRRILQVGYDAIVKSIDETCAFEGRAGSAVCAAGVLRAINRGLRRRLSVTATVTAPPDENA